MPDSTQLDRREFAKSLIVASGAVATTSAAATVTSADDKPANETTKPTKPDSNTPAPLNEETLLLHCLTRRYPSEHYNESILRGIYHDLRGDVARGRILSEFPLKNSDGPSFQFRAYRGSD